ncbi:hypothetical protein QYF36_017138 [Acer negundo]|nr:hypothetical protein QYF36_017138 [Acer negundo]
MIQAGNEENIKPLINLQGYILGNPVTESNIDGNSKIPFAHGMGLISDELYESLKRTCRGQYQIIDPSNADCLKHFQDYKKCISGVEVSHILKPKCPFASSKPHVEMFDKRRSLSHQHSRHFIDPEPEPELPSIHCSTYGFVLSRYWTNDKSVRKALHIREYHVSLSRKGYRSLIYSGDHDMMVPFVGTQAWIRSLNYSIVDDWRPWILHGQVAGFTRTYSNKMTFATVKGAGHTAPEYQPVECYSMFSRWISHDPL